ncbi:hypothetical protein MIMGU_mgv11b018737mg [Erythranthe guttata]|uniref:Uncharacterized protein n=1 Tax=Erythranthe guttata TaxID=4155 RepID=A0A022QRZ1_ERYGU|nr:hypothetical protein MIMGU_mgv11b018737mg [Erythranthe guttata]
MICFRTTPSLQGYLFHSNKSELVFYVERVGACVVRGGEGPFGSSVVSFFSFRTFSRNQKEDDKLELYYLSSYCFQKIILLQLQRNTKNSTPLPYNGRDHNQNGKSQ